MKFLEKLAKRMVLAGEKKEKERKKGMRVLVGEEDGWGLFYRGKWSVTF